MDNYSSGFLQKLKFSSGEITSCDLNANYVLAIGLSNNTVMVLEWKTGLGFVDMFYSPLDYHKYKITSVRFSPKGTMLASSSLDGTAVLLDVLKGTKIFTMVQHNKSNIRFCEFIFDCTKVITAADDGVLCFWDLLHQRQIRHFHLHESDYDLRSLTLSPDSEYLVSMDSVDLLKLWFAGDIINNEPRLIFLSKDVHSDHYCCRFSPVKNITGGGSSLKLKYGIATCGGDGSIKIWDLTVRRNQKSKTNSEDFECAMTLINVLKEHVVDIINVRFNSTGNYVVSTGLGNLVKLWEVHTGKCLQTFLGHTAFVTSAVFSKDSVLLATGSTDSVLIIYDLTQNLTIDSQLIIPCNVSCHFTHIDLTNYCNESGEANQIQNLEFIPVQKLNSSSFVNSVKFHGKDVLAVAGGEKTAAFWKRRDDSLVYENTEILKHKYSINYLDISPCGSKVIFCSVDGVVIFWDLNVKLTYEMKAPSCTASLRICKFQSESKFIAAAGDDEEVYLWDADNLEFLKIVQKHENAVTTLAFAPDGKSLVSGCEGGHIMLENVEQENWSGRINNAHDLGVTTCDFSSAAISTEECAKIYFTSLRQQCSRIYLLATGGKDSFVKLWGIAHFEIFILRVFSGHGGTVNNVKFSPSEPFILASCSSDTTVRIWHVKTEHCLHVLNFHKSAVTTCSFSSDSVLLATGSLDKTVLIFNLNGQFYLESTETISDNFNNKLLENWTTSDICEWLLKTGWTEAIDKVRTMKLDGRSLLITEIDTIVNSLGIKNEQERNEMKLQVLCLKKEALSFCLGVQYKEKNIPHLFLCPITHEVMKDPVICSDGYVYERAAITEWFLSGKFISPVTKENLKSTKFLTYSALKINIYKFLLKNEHDNKHFY